MIFLFPIISVVPLYIFTVPFRQKSEPRVAFSVSCISFLKNTERILDAPSPNNINAVPDGDMLFDFTLPHVIIFSPDMPPPISEIFTAFTISVKSVAVMSKIPATDSIMQAAIIVFFEHFISSRKFT